MSSILLSGETLIWISTSSPQSGFESRDVDVVRVELPEVPGVPVVVEDQLPVDVAAAHMQNILLAFARASISASTSSLVL